jgi:dTDP-4-dehydrorhamnose 3,5-epimerase
MAEDIKIVDGGLAVDDRGVISFVNEFDFQNVKRFYQLENFSKQTVRAWHGHLKEGKYIFVNSGSIILGVVHLDKTSNPSKSKEITRIILSSKKPQIVYVPPGYANGFRVIEENTKITFYSTASLEESEGDDYRYPFDYWGKEIWEIENR